MQNARTKLPQAQMSEERAVHLVRNALLVAGQEMGEDGDHWPVIKSTIHSVMKDYEDLKVERNVSEELRKYYAGIIANVEKNLSKCPADKQPDVQKILHEMREIYNARFEEPVGKIMYVTCDADEPIHIKRMKNIIETLEVDDE